MGHWSRTKDFEGNFWLYSTIKSLLLSHQMKASKDRKADSSSFWQIRRLCICLHAKIWWLWFVTKDFNEMWISLNELNKPKGKYWLDITWPWWEFTQPSQLSLQNSTYVIRGKKKKHIDFKLCPGNGTGHRTMMYQLETRPNVLLLELRVLCVACLGQEPLG